MPLRAKILNPAFAGSMQMSTKSEEDDVLFTSNFATRVVTLNRPRKLNALNISMVEKITPRLIEWKKSELAKIIILKSSSPKAFSAGGDVASLTNVPVHESSNFFSAEYILDYILATYNKPIVVFMDGITMGGGAGMSMHVPFRVATEKTVFSMPESLIGFYPDVGASFFLSRMDGELGTYLALTGERLNGFEALLGNAATHYVHSSRLEEIQSRLANLDYAAEEVGMERLNAVINSALSDFETEAPSDFVYRYSGENRKIIDRAFSGKSVENIKKTLEEYSSTSEFAKQTLETMETRCPTSMKVALEALRQAKSWSILDAFKWDIHLANKFMGTEDFITGVTHRVVNKRSDKPDWQPVPQDKEVKEKFFKFKRDDELLSQHYDTLEGIVPSESVYSHYPYKNGLPSESEVQGFVLGEDSNSGPFLMTKNEILRHFLDEYQNKLGVKEKVMEILDRKTSVVQGHEEEGLVNWNEK
ncbi:ClpP/crotonase-like domain-containing protein [Dipodascopsis uninucleata]